MASIMRPDPERPGLPARLRGRRHLGSRRHRPERLPGPVLRPGPRVVPLGHLRPDAPPYFVAHGDHDTVAPLDVVLPLVEGLRRTSRSPVVHAELPGAQHGFDLYHSVRFETLINGVEAFTAWVRTSRSGPPQGEDLHLGRRGDAG